MKTDALFEMVLVRMSTNSELLATKRSKDSRKCAVSMQIAPQVRLMKNLG